MGMIIMSSLVLVQQYFDRRRAIAGGIASAGFSLGSLVGGPATHVAIDFVGWRGAVMFIGAAFLQGAVLGCLFRPTPTKTSTAERTVVEEPQTNGRPFIIGAQLRRSVCMHIVAELRICQYS